MGTQFLLLVMIMKVFIQGGTAQAGTCPTDYFLGGDSCYKIYQMHENRSEAEVLCARDQVQLASLSQNHEKDFAKILMERGGGSFWISSLRGLCFYIDARNQKVRERGCHRPLRFICQQNLILPPPENDLLPSPAPVLTPMPKSQDEIIINLKETARQIILALLGRNGFTNQKYNHQT